MPSAEKIAKYANLLKRLFPIGRAWEYIIEMPLFEGIAVEFGRVDDRAEELLVELDPLTSEELLEDWENLLGLPDDCVPEGQTLLERQTQARNKLSNQGGQSAQYFEDFALSVGIEDVIVSNFSPFLVGQSRVGDAFTNGFDTPFRVGQNRVGDSLHNWGWTFYFEVNSLATITEPFRVGINRVGDRLVEFGNPLLECLIIKQRPAHTFPYFTFREP